MIPLYPMQLTLLGSAMYHELCFGLLRALSAPWLAPGPLTRAAERTGHPHAPSTVRPQPRAVPNVREAGEAVRRPAACDGLVIDVPLARWRRYRAEGAGSVVEP